MAKAHVGMMPTNPIISKRKEMHIPNSYRDTKRIVKIPNSTLYKDCKNFVSQCDRCQRLGRPLPSIEIPLISINPSLTFEIWAINFIGPFLIQQKEQVEGT